MGYKVNTNIDTSTVIPQWLINKEVQLEGGGFGELTPSQYFKVIIMQSISSAHKTGNLGVLRRTQAIAKQLDAGGVIEFDEQDYSYMKSSMGKAEWNNALEIINSIQPVLDALENAEVS